jgi:beta-1,2-mannobiose phosphorylase / 1,2-beta-oligomannan phosphorylase
MIKFLGTAQNEKQSILFFRQTDDGYNFFKYTVSPDGLKFNEKAKYSFALDPLQRPEQNYDWSSFRIAKQTYEYILTYKQSANKSSNIAIALSTDLNRWQKIGELNQIKETASIVSDFKFNKQHVMYFGEKDINVAYSSNLYEWTINEQPLLKSRKNAFDSSNLEVANTFLVNNHILVLYYVKNEVKDVKRYMVGAAFFDKNDPTKCIWRTEKPIWEHPEQLHHEKLHPLGSVILNKEIILYWLISDKTILAVSCQIPHPKQIHPDKAYSAVIKKFKSNPIIAPIINHPWESRATFNSAALFEDGKVHFLYRALGDKDLSVLGYANSSDGLTIDERSSEPAYIPREPFETPGGNTFNSFAEHFASGGGYGGVEDPRITRVEDKVYLTYVAFNGATNPRSAISSINVDDFLRQDWDKWAKPKLISAPGMTNKSAVVFPRKINGKYVVFHRVYPNILVDYLDDLEFNEFLQGHHFIPPRKHFWDSKKIGAGAPPLETKDGWLLIYQSVGYQDPSKYKVGAMMLDKDNPSKVLYRTNAPIIEPDQDYENEGFKRGVVYPCGAVIMKDKLHIYYGGADTVVCAASADLNNFLDQMKHHQEPKLSTVTSSLI